MFRRYKYTTTKVKYSSDPEVLKDNKYFDTGTSITLGDRAYIYKASIDLEVKKLATPILVRGLKN